MRANLIGILEDSRTLLIAISLLLVTVGPSRVAAQSLPIVIAGDAGTEESNERWYFADLSAALGISAGNPLPLTFKSLRSRMAPKDVAGVFAAAAKPQTFDRGDGDIVWRSTVDAPGGDGVIYFMFEFTKYQGRIGLDSASMHFSQARYTKSFHHDLVRAVILAFGKPSFTSGRAMAWPWGEIVDAGDHYAYRAYLEPREFFFMNGLK